MLMSYYLYIVKPRNQIMHENENNIVKPRTKTKPTTARPKTKNYRTGLGTGLTSRTEYHWFLSLQGAAKSSPLRFFAVFFSKRLQF